MGGGRDGISERLATIATRGFSRIRGRAYDIFVVIFLTGALAVGAANPFFVQAVRLIGFDLYQRVAPRSYDPDLPVRIVDIDDSSLARIGQWPWPRTVMAELRDRLAADGAAVVAFDVMFAEADRTSLDQIAAHLTEPAAAAARAAT